MIFYFEMNCISNYKLQALSSSDVYITLNNTTRLEIMITFQTVQESGPVALYMSYII